MKKIKAPRRLSVKAIYNGRGFRGTVFDANIVLFKTENHFTTKDLAIAKAVDFAAEKGLNCEVIEMAPFFERRRKTVRAKPSLLANWTKSASRK